jgi:hypothetical protein
VARIVSPAVTVSACDAATFADAVAVDVAETEVALLASGVISSAGEQQSGPQQLRSLVIGFRIRK